MLDTDVVSDLVRAPRGRVFTRIREVGETRVCASIITAAELRYGCVRKGSAALTARVAALLGELSVLPFDQPTDAAYGAIRAELEAAGTPIGPNDMLIAAHAQAAGAVLVSGNTREFARVGGLRLENWLV